MNHLVANAIGIDAVIKKIQEQIYPELVTLWTVNSEAPEINGYGRVYKNIRKFRKIPEVFLGQEDDYDDAFFDDNADANFFFIANENNVSDDEVFFTNRTKVVFCLDLTKCYTGDDRLDALAHRDVVSIMRNLPISGKYRITGYETGIEKVFSGFTTTGIEKDDLHPTHIFAVLIDLNYSLTDKCS